MTVTCLEINRLQHQILDRPTRTYFEIARVVQAKLVQLAADSATPKQLQDTETFRVLVGYAVVNGLTAAEIANLVGVSKSTVLRWANGSATPHYESAREIFGTKILDRLHEHWIRALENDGCDDVQVSIETDRQVRVTLESADA